MAELSTEDRLRIWRGLQRWWSKQREAMPLSKPELQEAVDTTDAWIEANQGNYNSALSAAAQDNLTVTQKTLLFCAVAVARVSIQFLRQLMGEVD